MNREKLIAFLQGKEEEKHRHLEASIYMDGLKRQLPERVFNHVQAIISSNVAACDISIRDHERDLERIDWPSYS
jgi:hypothetical protein